MLNKITIWSVITEEGNLKHNHIEDGWNYGGHPEPISEKFSNQKAWKKLNWHKEHGYLVDGKVENMIREIKI
ncbi:hypothetical protein FKN04_12790 [Bacillus glycinifermentans]|uniref:hypothetical protein n=1 Tax=Bacillus glycinifermentans TaxID=1664069 RepID=UPI0015819A58|nr:hypothetical protein [Bacillus glycinifermentans]NUJ17452.1 hypothetical protein [Bacillus glycinifermentans]